MLDTAVLGDIDGDSLLEAEVIVLPVESSII
jgi:hypothetical protein